jgi:hypothetical protein
MNVRASLELIPVKKGTAWNFLEETSSAGFPGRKTTSPLTFPSSFVGLNSPKATPVSSWNTKSIFIFIWIREDRSSSVSLKTKASKDHDLSTCFFHDRWILIFVVSEINLCP